MSQPTIEVTEDFTDKFNTLIKKFKQDAVLVGIPATDSSREDGQISNAALLAINNFGSPINNIPPRPVMAIGIKRAQDDIAEEFANAFRRVFDQGIPALLQYYSRAGIIASNSIKRVINDQIDIPGPSPATLAARKSAGFSGKKSLIVTAQMRNAITYVVQGGGL